MGKAICLVDGCQGNAVSRGWCMKHYTRWRNHGDPCGGGPDSTRPVAERFWEKVEKTDSCWLWTAAKKDNGYGAFWDGERQTYAHRVSYRLSVGPIADGLVIDHLCRVRSCVRPAHLEPVSNGVNLIRGIGPTLAKARRYSKPDCRQGHEYTESNTYVEPKTGNRVCRICQRAKNRRRYARRRGESLNNP